jgi:hypothetical protein
LPRISDKRCPVLQLFEDLRRVLHRLCLIGRRRCQENLAHFIFFGPLGSVELLKNRFHLVVTDGDAALDFLALQPGPGNLAFDLSAQRAD